MDLICGQISVAGPSTPTGSIFRSAGTRAGIGRRGLPAQTEVISWGETSATKEASGLTWRELRLPPQSTMCIGANPFILHWTLRRQNLARSKVGERVTIKGDHESVGCRFNGIGDLSIFT